MAIKYRITLYLISSVVLIAVAMTPQRASAQLLELALIIDGSSSISGPNGNVAGPDWGLQIGAYQSVFQNNFYTNFIVPSQFTEIAVAAYVFSGGITETINDGTTDFVNNIIVSSFLDWTLITNDAQASAFGGMFAGLPQPGGTTHTSGAIDIAVNGGQVSCTTFNGNCSPAAPLTPPFTLTATGLLNNSFAGDKLVIDISTDGVPTEPTGGGTPNETDDALAITAADNARSAGITVNALGVGGVDATFLDALVGINPADSPTGFVITATDFTQFESALITKIGQETAVPVPAAIWLFGSGLLGLVGIARRKQSA